MYFACLDKAEAGGGGAGSACDGLKKEFEGNCM